MVSGLGDTSYAAVTQAGRFSFLFMLFCFGVTSGGAIFMSQFWGRQGYPPYAPEHGCVVRLDRRGDRRVHCRRNGFPGFYQPFVPAARRKRFFSEIIFAVGRAVISVPGTEHGVRRLHEVKRENTYPADLLHRRHRTEHAAELLPDLREFRIPGDGRARRGADHNDLRGGHARADYRHGLRLAPACGREAQGHAGHGARLPAAFCQDHYTGGLQRGAVGAGCHDVRHLLRTHGRHSGSRDGRMLHDRQPFCGSSSSA